MNSVEVNEIRELPKPRTSTYKELNRKYGRASQTVIRSNKQNVILQILNFSLVIKMSVKRPCQYVIPMGCRYRYFTSACWLSAIGAVSQSSSSESHQLSSLSFGRRKQIVFNSCLVK